MNIDWNILKYIGGVATAMLMNTTFGIAKASKTETFDVEKLKDGLIKYAWILLGVVLMFATGLLVPDTTISVDGVGEGLTFIEIIVKVSQIAIGYFGVKAVLNLIIALGLTTIIKETSTNDDEEVKEKEVIIEETKEEEELG